jgi:hypothetical protein
MHSPGSQRARVGFLKFSASLAGNASLLPNLLSDLTVNMTEKWM